MRPMFPLRMSSQHLQPDSNESRRFHGDVVLQRLVLGNGGPAMPRTRKPGRLQFCIELGLSPNQTALSQHRQLVVLAEMLSGTLHHRGVSATWAVADPGLGFIRETLSSSKSHDLALLVDHSWALNDEEQFARELNRRLSIAIDNRLQVRSLVFARHCEVRWLRPISKCNLNVVRWDGLRDTTASYTRASVHELTKQGCLHLNSSALFPGTGGILSGGDMSFAAKRVLHRAMKQGSTEHVSICVADMLAAPARTVRALDRMLVHAVRLERAGRIQVETIQQATTRLCPTATGKRAHSILRPAA